MLFAIHLFMLFETKYKILCADDFNYNDYDNKEFQIPTTHSQQKFKGEMLNRK